MHCLQFSEVKESMNYICIYIYIELILTEIDSSSKNLKFCCHKAFFN